MVARFGKKAGFLQGNQLCWPYSEFVRNSGLYLIALAQLGGNNRLVEKPIKSLKLWGLVVGLALGNLLGCSRSSKLIDTSAARIRAEVPLGPVQAKPSPCIKLDEDPGRFSKRLRKAKATTIPKESQKRDFHGAHQRVAARNS